MLKKMKGPQTKELKTRFEKTEPKLASNGQILSSHAPYTYDTPQQPKMSSNIKRATKTYNRGNVPAHNTGDPFSRKNRDLRIQLYNKENQIVVNKDKKYTKNQNKAYLGANTYKQF